MSLAAPFLAAWVATKNAGARTRAKLVTMRTKICVLRFRSLRRRLKIHAASFAGQTLKLLAAKPDRVLLTLPDLLPEVSARYPELDGRWKVDRP